MSNLVLMVDEIDPDTMGQIPSETMEEDLFSSNINNKITIWSKTACNVSCFHLRSRLRDLVGNDPCNGIITE